MSEHDFSNLFDKYPEVIDKMENTFNSHQFISELAWQNQPEYVEALYAYRNSDPFKIVHGRLAKQIGEYADQDGYVKSEHIFRETTECAQWRKKL